MFSCVILLSYSSIYLSINAWLSLSPNNVSNELSVAPEPAAAGSSLTRSYFLATFQLLLFYRKCILLVLILAAAACDVAFAIA